MTLLIFYELSLISLILKNNFKKFKLKNNAYHGTGNSFEDRGYRDKIKTTRE